MRKLTVLCMLLALLGILWQATAATPPPNPIVAAWQALNTLFTPLRAECPDEHTWLPDRGIRGFYCHAKAKLDYAALVRLAGQPAFASGPHSQDKLNLTAKYEFGHYRPEFVKWLREHMVPGKQDSALRAVTQPWYDQYLRQRARSFYVVYQRLLADPAYLSAELNAYQAFMKAKEAERFDRNYFYYEKLHEQGYDGYEVASAVSFWMRRTIDGTAAEFSAALAELLQVYDTEFLASQQSQAKPQAQVLQCVEKVMKNITEIFPEAYTQFMAVNYEWQDVGEIWPTQATFYVPARLFPTPLSEAVLRARLDETLKRILRPNDAHCEEIRVEKPEELGWLAWPDKQVRKVVITFGIGC